MKFYTACTYIYTCTYDPMILAYIIMYICMCMCDASVTFLLQVKQLPMDYRSSHTKVSGRQAGWLGVRGIRCPSIANERLAGCMLEIGCQHSLLIYEIYLFSSLVKSTGRVMW